MLPLQRRQRRRLRPRHKDVRFSEEPNSNSALFFSRAERRTTGHGLVIVVHEDKGADGDMPHLHRFYLAQAPVVHTHEAVLTDHEAHHALHVVRLRTGDTIEVFDGAGREWDGTVTTTTRHEVRIALANVREHPAPRVPFTLFQAWLHRDKAVEELIRHGSEIGFARFVFFRSQHSERAPRATDKWRRTAIEACKQCRRVWLPEFETADSLEAAIKMVTRPMIVATWNISPAPLASLLEGAERVSLFVGPEGDFSGEEIALFRHHGAGAISLGSTTYRSEVASVLAGTLIQYELGQLGPRKQQ